MWKLHCLSGYDDFLRWRLYIIPFSKETLRIRDLWRKGFCLPEKVELSSIEHLEKLQQGTNVSALNFNIDQSFTTAESLLLSPKFFYCLRTREGYCTIHQLLAWIISTAQAGHPQGSVKCASKLLHCYHEIASLITQMRKMRIVAHRMHVYGGYILKYNNIVFQHIKDSFLEYKAALKDIFLQISLFRKERIWSLLLNAHYLEKVSCNSFPRENQFEQIGSSLH